MEETETNIVIDNDWDYNSWNDEECLVINKIWCERCSHKFDVVEYSESMIEDMNYCPFCGKKIRRVVYE